MSEDQATSSAQPRFAFVCCHHGAAPAVKTEVDRQGWRLAFSRPGFVTLKSDRATGPLPTGIFVRCASHSLLNIKGTKAESMADELLGGLDKETSFQQLHVWDRDRTKVGQFGFHPGPSEVSEAVADVLLKKMRSSDRVAAAAANQIAVSGDRVLDVVLVQPDLWFCGYHVATEGPTCWPGGVFPQSESEHVISRAYYKAAEAIAWSGFPFHPGDRCVEIGSAPGGACQRLLEMGMRVTGIDPAEMDPQLIEHPKFEHIRARGGDIPRASYRPFRWLFVDSNVRPEKTLTTIRNVVSNRQVRIEGMLVTLKLPTYDDAALIEDWLDEIASWGYDDVRARQLPMNRQEICVAARRS